MTLLILAIVPVIGILATGGSITITRQVTLLHLHSSGPRLSDAIDANESLVRIRSLLDQYPGSINVQNSVGQCPLHQAVLKGRVDLVKLLVERGADVNAQVAKQWVWEDDTPLMIAVEKENVQIVKALLKAGADPTIRGDYGWLPVTVAGQEKNPEIVSLLQKATTRRWRSAN